MRLAAPGAVRSSLLVVVASLLVLAALRAGTAMPARAAEARPLTAYAGAGSWVSIYDTSAWRRPERVVQTLAAHGIHTLFLQTSNYRQSADVVRPIIVGRFLDAAHAAGIDVVGWYLPSLAAPARDLRRARAAIDFRSLAGERFDSFALDIEATGVRSLPTRNARAVQLAAALRRSAPPGYPLGGITIAPVGASPSYWPGYPYRGLARSLDIFLPMAYFTARVHGARSVGAYTAANLRFIHAQTGNASFPIHPIGGEARRATRQELAAFFDAAAACNSVGASLWEYGQTTPPQWAALAAATPATPAVGC